MMRKIVFVLIAPLILLLTSCMLSSGSILIKENLAGNGCEILFLQWSRQEKCELQLNNGDELQVEVMMEEGEIDLSVRSAKGNEPYAGRNLKTSVFTVKVSESGSYKIFLNGENATGSIVIKKLSKP